MPFVWHIGTVIGPSIGGTFADPHESFPNLFPAGSLFERFPYLLPNVICAGLLLASVLMGFFLLEETHPMHRAAGVYISRDVSTAHIAIFEVRESCHQATRST